MNRYQVVLYSCMLVLFVWYITLSPPPRPKRPPPPVEFQHPSVGLREGGGVTMRVFEPKMNSQTPWRARPPEALYGTTFSLQKTGNIVSGRERSAMAWGSKERISGSGISWTRLRIYSAAQYPAVMQAYSAGYLEGFLTWPEISSFATNSYEKIMSAVMEKGNHTLAIIEDKWQSLSNSCNRSLDTTECLVWWQVRGLGDGYGSVEQAPHIDLLSILFMNSYEDLMHLSGTGQWTNDVHSIFMKKTESDVLASFLSSSITDSKSSTRLAKTYKLPYTGADFEFTCLSYAGIISSPDSFYATSNNLFIFRMPPEIFFDLAPPENGVSTHSRLSLLRTLPALWLSHSLSEWASLYIPSDEDLIPPAKWIVLDYNDIDNPIVGVVDEQWRESVFSTLTTSLRAGIYFHVHPHSLSHHPLEVPEAFSDSSTLEELEGKAQEIVEILVQNEGTPALDFLLLSGKPREYRDRAVMVSACRNVTSTNVLTWKPF
ncbi:hypothetical protein Pelo_3634 [Pelomyxa schiedti]|nr:hypothetical protein Pelo_3634 [Pelomyxa schiedti]